MEIHQWYLWEILAARGTMRDQWDHRRNHMQRSA